MKKKKITFAIESDTGALLCNLISEAVTGRSDTFDKTPMKELKKVAAVTKQIQAQL